MVDNVTRELTERRLDYENGETNTFYCDLPKPVRMGIEATGLMHWFKRSMTELGHELWIRDSAKIRASDLRKQKNRRARCLIGKRSPMNTSHWASTNAQVLTDPVSYRFVG